MRTARANRSQYSSNLFIHNSIADFVGANLTDTFGFRLTISQISSIVYNPVSYLELAEEG
jgi:hypothetical protein